MNDARHGDAPDDPPDDPRRSDEHPAAAGNGYGDGRDQVPGAHPEVERSSRSKTTAIALVVVLAAAGLLYLAIVIQMTVSG